MTEFTGRLTGMRNGLFNDRRVVAVCFVHSFDRARLLYRCRDATDNHFFFHVAASQFVADDPVKFAEAIQRKEFVEQVDAAS